MDSKTKAGKNTIKTGKPDKAARNQNEMRGEHPQEEGTSGLDVVWVANNADASMFPRIFGIGEKSWHGKKNGCPT